MRPRLLSILFFISLTWSPLALAGQMSTYIKGTVIKKTRTHWVVQTPEGLYWVKVIRPPSYTKKYSELEMGFWVQQRHIKRFRPNTQTASN